MNGALVSIQRGSYLGNDRQMPDISAGIAITENAKMPIRTTQPGSFWDAITVKAGSRSEAMALAGMSVNLPGFRILLCCVRDGEHGSGPENST